MNKNITILVVFVLILLFGVYKFAFVDNISKTDLSINFYDGEYEISGQKFVLKNGLSKIPIPNSSSKIITKYFGNDADGDIDGDGINDKVFLLTQETGGTGTFYYLAGILNKQNGRIFARPVFIGDRIAPQNTRIENGEVLVNYADRNYGESFDVRPSLGKTLYLKLDPKIMEFGELVKDFPGEADPDRMSLFITTWNWIGTKYADNTEIKPKTNKFSLKFEKNKNTFSATTDCNGVSGEYLLNDKKIFFDKMISTLMYCEGSQEALFTKMLGQVESFYFTSRGELVFNLKGGGTMIFK